MKMNIHKKKKKLLESAKNEMNRLFVLSKNSFPLKECSNYSKHAFLFSQRHKIPLSISQRRDFCKKCFNPLFPSITQRVRIKKGKNPLIISTCLNCRNVKRFGFNKS